MEELRIDPTIAYDVVELPTKGIFYKNNKKSLRIAYLTAADENVLLSPNLMQGDAVIDELLKRKIIDKDFDIKDFLKNIFQMQSLRTNKVLFFLFYRI